MEKKLSVPLGELTIDCTIVRDTRKTLKIAVSPAGEVVVTIPRRMTQHDVVIQIERHRAWLLKRLTQSANVQTQYRDIINLQSAVLYGTRFAIVNINDGKSRSSLHWDGSCLKAANCEQKLKQKLMEFYKKETTASLNRMIPEFAVIVGAQPSFYCAKSQKRLWGSCNSKKELRFNLLLCMMPIPVIEYVVVHELCHLKQMNHSPAFWREVARILPDYEVRRHMLRTFGDSLAAVYTEVWVKANEVCLYPLL